MDIIGNITLNTRFRFQEDQRNPIAAAMRDTIEQQFGVETSTLSQLNPYRFYKQWQNSRTMDYYIGVELETRFQEWKQSNQQYSRSPKSIMDIILAEYMKIQHNIQEQTSLDPEFKKWATIQTRLFLFVGHDSEAATIIYSIYLLSKIPDILTKVREEHDRIFGSGPGISAHDALMEHPQKINQLPYTLAVIKETLRLFPPANGLRGCQPGVSLHDEHGRAFPTEGVNIWIIHTAVQRNPDFWPKPHDFIPDRWLVEKDHPLYPPAGGWVPFEHGARQCIGQNISLMGIKTTLVVVLRQFDFHDAYAEYDALNCSSSGGQKTMFGDRIYMIQKGSGHPAQGFPCKVSIRNGKEGGKAYRLQYHTSQVAKI